MAERVNRIVWSKNALRDIKEIFEYWNKTNGNKDLWKWNSRDLNMYSTHPPAPSWEGEIVYNFILFEITSSKKIFILLNFFLTLSKTFFRFVSTTVLWDDLNWRRMAQVKDPAGSRNKRRRFLCDWSFRKHVSIECMSLQPSLNKTITLPTVCFVPTKFKGNK